MSGDEPEPFETFVGMFDLLGFKALRNATGTAALHRYYTRHFVPSIQHSAARGTKLEERDGQTVLVPDQEWIVGWRFFSDTVVFWAPDTSFEAFLAMTRASVKLLKFCFGAHKPLRGSIGFGDIIVDGSVLLGSAVEDAYLGEQSQVWAGCALTEAAEMVVRERGYLKQWEDVTEETARLLSEDDRKLLALESRLLVEYDIPLQRNPKDGPISYYFRKGLAVDWTRRMFEGAASKAFPNRGCPDVRLKAENTEEFEAWAGEHRKELLAGIPWLQEHRRRMGR